MTASIPKTVLVTGASNRFGKLVACQLARRGHLVYAGLADTRGRDHDAVRELCGEARRDGVRLRSTELDLTDGASVDHALRAIRMEAGGLDVLVHVGGAHELERLRRALSGTGAELLTVPHTPEPRRTAAAIGALVDSIETPTPE